MRRENIFICFFTVKPKLVHVFDSHWVSFCMIKNTHRIFNLERGKKKQDLWNLFCVCVIDNIIILLSVFIVTLLCKTKQKVFSIKHMHMPGLCLCITGVIWCPRHLSQHMRGFIKSGWHVDSNRYNRFKVNREHWACKFES